MEKRKPDSLKPSPLPSDYLKMVSEVFASNFDEGLKRIKKLTKETSRFECTGAVFPSEIVLCVTLVHGKDLSATSVYASADFDPKASTPTIQDLLAYCVDAAGTVLMPLLTAKKDSVLEDLVNSPLSALENVPFEWTSVEVEKRRIYVKLDKSNPRLEEMADEWLRKHDPDLARLEEEQEAETERLFVTGPSRAGAKKPGSGSLH